MPQATDGVIARTLANNLILLQQHVGRLQEKFDRYSDRCLAKSLAGIELSVCLEQIALLTAIQSGKIVPPS